MFPGMSKDLNPSFAHIATQLLFSIFSRSSLRSLLLSSAIRIFICFTFSMFSTGIWRHLSRQYFFFLLRSYLPGQNAWLCRYFSGIPCNAFAVRKQIRQSYLFFSKNITSGSTSGRIIHNKVACVCWFKAHAFGYFTPAFSAFSVVSGNILVVLPRGSCQNEKQV